MFPFMLVGCHAKLLACVAKIVISTFSTLVALTSESVALTSVANYSVVLSVQGVRTLETTKQQHKLLSIVPHC